MGQYDITTKALTEGFAADWLALAELPVDGPITSIESELATVLPMPDKLHRVGDAATGYIAHLDFQASLDVEIDRRMTMYNVAAGWRHRLDVRTALFLMRPEADSPKVTGSFRRVFDPRSRLEFSYPIIRVWQLPVERILSAGTGTLPLAPISDVREPDLPRVIDRMRERFKSEVPQGKAAELWIATDILMGLRYSEAFATALLSGVRDMEESTTYQAILRKGEARGVAIGRLRHQRSVLIKLGTARFGPPPASAVARIDQLDDSQQLDDMAVGVLTADGWDAVMRIGQ